MTREKTFWCLMCIIFILFSLQFILKEWYITLPIMCMVFILMLVARGMLDK